MRLRASGFGLRREGDGRGRGRRLASELAAIFEILKGLLCDPARVGVTVMLCIAGVAADASTRGDLHLADGNLGQDRNFARIPQPPAILVEDGKAQHGVRNEATRTGCELVAAVLGGKSGAL